MYTATWPECVAQIIELYLSYDDTQTPEDFLEWACKMEEFFLSKNPHDPLFNMQFDAILWVGSLVEKFESL